MLISLTLACMMTMACGIPAAENALQPADYVSLQSDLLLWTVAHSEVNQFVDEFIGYRYFYRLYPESDAGTSAFTIALAELDEGIDFNEVETVLLGQLGYRSLLPSGTDGNIATASVAVPPSEREEAFELALALDPLTGITLRVPDGLISPDDADSGEDIVVLGRAANSGEAIGELSSSGFTLTDPDIEALQAEFPDDTLAGTLNLRVALAVAAIGLSADGLSVLYSGITAITEPPADGSVSRSGDEAADAFLELFALEVTL